MGFGEMGGKEYCRDGAENIEDVLKKASVNDEKKEGGEDGGDGSPERTRKEAYRQGKEGIHKEGRPKDKAGKVRKKIIRHCGGDAKD
jgi:hypothetical protein